MFMWWYNIVYRSETMTITLYTDRIIVIVDYMNTITLRALKLQRIMIIVQFMPEQISLMHMYNVIINSYFTNMSVKYLLLLLCYHLLLGGAVSEFTPTVYPAKILSSSQSR